MAALHLLNFFFQLLLLFMPFIFLPYPFITLSHNNLRLINNVASYFFTYSQISKVNRETFCVRQQKLEGKGSQRSQNYSESFRHDIQTILRKKLLIKPLPGYKKLVQTIIARKTPPFWSKIHEIRRASEIYSIFHM